jgi:hydroxymethylpyrimidine/phosphomethylpyrimidine kinase
VARPAVLVIAATDSSGGAGLTRDVRVLSDFSVDALCVVTAVTAQSDKQVTAVHHVPPDVIRAQIAAALATRQVGAIKIGMLGNRATVEAVVEGLRGSRSVRGWSGPLESVASGSPPVGSSLREGRFHEIPVVVDPVLVSTSGGVLLDAGGQAALTEALFPLATLVTPNVPEAAALLGEALAADEAELVQQGMRLLGFGSRAILLKGGHRYAGECTADRGNAGRGDANHTDTEDAVDLLVSGNGTAVGPRSVERIVSQRVGGTSRGTGCALASAIAAGLAAGKPLNEACRAAKNYVLGMLGGQTPRTPFR